MQASAPLLALGVLALVFAAPVHAQSLDKYVYRNGQYFVGDSLVDDGFLTVQLGEKCATSGCSSTDPGVSYVITCAPERFGVFQQKDCGGTITAECNPGTYTYEPDAVRLAAREPADVLEDFFSYKINTGTNSIAVSGVIKILPINEEPDFLTETVIALDAITTASGTAVSGATALPFLDPAQLTNPDGSDFTMNRVLFDLVNAQELQTWMDNTGKDIRDRDDIAFFLTTDQMQTTGDNTVSGQYVNVPKNVAYIKRQNDVTNPTRFYFYFDPNSEEVKDRIFTTQITATDCSCKAVQQYNSGICHGDSPPNPIKWLASGLNPTIRTDLMSCHPPYSAVDAARATPKCGDAYVCMNRRTLQIQVGSSTTFSTPPNYEFNKKSTPLRIPEGSVVYGTLPRNPWTKTGHRVGYRIKEENLEAMHGTIEVIQVTQNVPNGEPIQYPGDLQFDSFCRAGNPESVDILPAGSYCEPLPAEVLEDGTIVAAQPETMTYITELERDVCCTGAGVTAVWDADLNRAVCGNTNERARPAKQVYGTPDVLGGMCGGFKFTPADPHYHGYAEFKFEMYSVDAVTGLEDTTERATEFTFHMFIQPVNDLPYVVGFESPITTSAVVNTETAMRSSAFTPASTSQSDQLGSALREAAQLIQIVAKDVDYDAHKGEGDLSLSDPKAVITNSVKMIIGSDPAARLRNGDLYYFPTSLDTEPNNDYNRDLTEENQLLVKLTVDDPDNPGQRAFIQREIVRERLPADSLDGEFVWDLYYLPDPLVRGDPAADEIPVVLVDTFLDDGSVDPDAPAVDLRIAVKIQCAAGYKKHDADGDGKKESCIACSPGEAQSAMDQATCIPCNLGEFADQVAMSSCRACPENTYQDETGQDYCKYCPLNYLYDEDVATAPVPADLLASMAMDLSPEARAEAETTNADLVALRGTSASPEKSKDVNTCTCTKDPDVGYQDDYTVSGVPKLGARGYYGLPGHSCIPCGGPAVKPERATVLSIWTVCDADNQRWPKNADGFFVQINGVHPAPPKSADHPHPITGADDWPATMTATAEECSPPPTSVNKDTPGYDAGACVALNTVEEVLAGGCSAGYDGQRCGLCATSPEKYYRLEGVCFECPKGNNSATSIIILGVLVLLFAPILFKSGSFLANMPSLNIAINFGQVLAVFPSFAVNWPKELRDMFSVFSSINFNIELIHPECVASWKWEDKFLITVAAPLAIVGLCFLIVLLMTLHHLVTSTLGKGIKKIAPHLLVPAPEDKAIPVLSSMRLFFMRKLCIPMMMDEMLEVVRTMLRFLLVFFKVGYIFLASGAIEYFDCNESNESSWFLDAEPSIQCYTFDDKLPNGDDNVWGSLFVTAVLSVIAYPIGILVLFWALLYAVRYNLDHEANLAVVGALYFRYESKYFWWEIVILLRKLLVIATEVFFSGQTKLNGLKQIIVTMAVLLVSLLYTMHAKPYDNMRLNYLESASLGAMFFTSFSGMVFLAEDRLSETFKAFLNIMTMCVVGISMTAMVFHLYLDVKPQIDFKWEQFKHKRRLAKMRKAKQGDVKKPGFFARVCCGKEAPPAPVTPSLSVGMYIKIKQFARRARLSKYASRVLSPTGMRITEQLLKDKTPGMPSKEELIEAFKKMDAAINPDAKKQLLVSKSETPLRVCLKPRLRTMILEGLTRLSYDDAQDIKTLVEMMFHNKSPDGSLTKRILTCGVGGKPVPFNPRSPNDENICFEDLLSAVPEQQAIERDAPAPEDSHKSADNSREAAYSSKDLSESADAAREMDDGTAAPVAGPSNAAFPSAEELEAEIAAEPGPSEQAEGLLNKK